MIPLSSLLSSFKAIVELCLASSPGLWQFGANGTSLGDFPRQPSSQSQLPPACSHAVLPQQGSSFALAHTALCALLAAGSWRQSWLWQCCRGSWPASLPAGCTYRVPPVAGLLGDDLLSLKCCCSQQLPALSGSWSCSPRGVVLSGLGLGTLNKIDSMLHHALQENLSASTHGLAWVMI